MTSIAYRAADLANVTERKFVVDSWVASYRDAFTAGIVQVEDWYQFMIPTVEKILAKPDVRTVVAYVEGVTDHIADLVGFITADAADSPPLVYYVFTKEHYRRAGRGRIWGAAGVGRGLFEAAGVDPTRPFNYVCSTPMCRTLQRKIPLARWQPLLGRFSKSERRSRR